MGGKAMNWLSGRIRSKLVLAVVSVLGLLSLAPPSQAVGPDTFSGLNGRIAFASDRSGHSQIYSVLPDGRGLRQLTHASGDSVIADYSPDGRKITFDSDRTGQVQIYTMNADGSQVRQLTHGSNFSGDPAYSPDGTRIAFNRCFSRAGCGIWVMDSNGRNQIALTSAAAINLEPTFSPDGSQIAFQSNRTKGVWAIYTMSANGSHVRRITPLSLDAAHADYSPDGLRIAFNSNFSVPHSSIFTVRPDGTGLRQLTDPASALNDFRPSYSPLGNLIVFNSTRNGFDIWVMNADGTQLHNITPGSRGLDFAPDWGPRVVP